MRIRTQIFLAIAILCAIGIADFVQWLNQDLKPRYRQAVEEQLVDTAVILSSLLAGTLKDGKIQPTEMISVLEASRKRNFHAEIYDALKQRVDLRVYVTDSSGTVLFDSHTPENVGADFSEWRDVALTLQGKYGARTTRDDEKDPTSTVLYVSAPIQVDERIAGVVTVGKPTKELNVLIDATKQRILLRGVLTALILALLGILLSALLSRPIQRLQRYVEAVRDGEKATLPKLRTKEVSALGESFEEMRIALEGKGYIEQYVQSLTHELKSPVAGIQGAAELLQENPPQEQQQRFLENIKRETGRIQRIVEKLLELAAVETKRELQNPNVVDLGELADQLSSEIRFRLERKGVSLNSPAKSRHLVLGDKFLLEQAMRNLMENALDFTSDGEQVSVNLIEEAGKVNVRVEDNGTGIPEYAISRVFERFFSLPRPKNNNKSSGLGLPFVREVARLHGGALTIENISPKGVRAVLSIPSQASFA